MLQLTFNPGLTLTGFRTTRPRTIKVSVRVISLSIPYLDLDYSGYNKNLIP